MSYKYLDAYSVIDSKSSKQNYEDDFQKLLEREFYNSTTIYTIKEETVFASKVFSDLDVRIVEVVKGETSNLESDDYKKLLYKSTSHPVEVGYLYTFDSNTWIAINTKRKKSLPVTSIVRRCNNTLRWISEDGGVYSEPCVIDYLIKENRNYSTAGSALVNASGMIEILVQFNERTNKIKENQRFLFGNSTNWTAFRVSGGGVNNLNNLETGDNDSSGFLRLTMAVDLENQDTDDLVNGIAYSENNVYTLSLSDSSISGSATDTRQLTAVVKLNGTTVIRSLVWESDDELVATVDSNGLVTLVAVGTCGISCSIEDNSDVDDSCSVDVSLTPADDYQIVVSPETNYVLEGSAEVYSIYLYLNGVQQADVFSFTLESNTIPDENYDFSVVDSNSFSIENITRYFLDEIVITCVSGIHSKQISVDLKGSF